MSTPTINTSPLAGISPQTQKILAIGICVLVAALCIFWWYEFGEPLDNVLTGIGLKDSETDKSIKGDKQKATQDDYFSTSYYLNPPSGYKSQVLAPQIVDGIVAKMHDAIGLLSTDYGAIQAALSKVVSKTQLSQVASYFSNKYSTSLYSFLNDNLNSAKPEIMLKIVGNNGKEIYSDILNRLNGLPSGFVKK